MARTFIRATAVTGAFGLGLLAMSPAVAATENQAGATAFSIEVAGQGAQGTGISTATYENGKETKSGATTPDFPQPAQDAFKLGVLEQEATASPGFTAACAGLGGHGKGQITIGDGSCLEAGNTLTGSLGTLDINSLINADPVAALKANAGPLADVLAALPDPTAAPGADQVKAAITAAINQALTQVRTQFGDGGLVANLALVEGRCTAGDGGPTGTSTLANAGITLNIPGRAPLTLLELPANPPPDTHLTTDLSKVLTLVLEAVRTDLTNSLDGQAAPLQAVIDQIEDNVVTNIRDQVEKNLAPLEENVLDIVLNEQEHPTPDSIKVRALHAQVLPVAKAQLGSSLVDLQIGDAACAPVARTATSVSPPQAVTPPVANPKTPTAVSSGLASVPGQQQGLDSSTWALVALAGLGLAGASLAGARRLFN